MHVPAPMPKNRAAALNRFFEAAIERQSEETVRTRAQGGFFVFGGVLALVWLLLFGVVVVIALMLAVLRERVNRLIARLADAARTDPLTGLLNRRGFQELMEVETERALRSSRPLAILVGDLDHFKHLNDRFGHAAGDLALKRFGEIASSASRRIDAVARIGGEEFALLLPDTEQHAAYLLAERLRRAVKEPGVDGELPSVSC